jgi:L-aminopeptidase/D-esterase-like protein
MKGGLGIAGFRSENLEVTAVAVVNAVGDVVDERGDVLAGARSPVGGWMAVTDPLRRLLIERPALPEIGNTTLVAILANCRLSKVDANRVAQRGHDGLARAIHPVHTMFDGDVVFTLASGNTVHPTDIVAEMGAAAAAAAVRSAVRHATSIHGVTALGGDVR